MSKDLSDKEKMILENLYRCRDLELNNLWQKSIFLGPFLILCFTGYGFLLDKLFQGESFSLKTNILCIALSIVSAIFSMLWIYMFKGSKAQYELCERAIANYEQRELNIPYGYAMGTLRYNEIEFDDNPLSTKAGKFSPSKINIVIGQVSLWLWIVCFIFHMLIDLKIINNILSGYSFIIGISVLILIFFCHKYIKSSYLSPSNQERYIRELLRIVSKEKSKKIVKGKDKDREYIEEIMDNNFDLLKCLRNIYETEGKVPPLFTEREEIYLDAYRYLVELGKIDISKQEESAPTTQEESASTAQEELESPTQEESVSTSSIDLKQELSSLASALGIEKKRMKELNKYIDEKYQK